MTVERIAIIGNTDGTNVGGSLQRAGQQAGLTVDAFPIAGAMRASWVTRQVNWRLRGHRPPRLNEYSQETLAALEKAGSQVLLAMGQAPLNRKALAELGRRGVLRGVYLTDDPWNPAHYAPWFQEALPEYDAVFTPRRQNIEQIRRVTPAPVHYLPFAWDPDLFFRPAVDEAARRAHGGEVVFAGGADRDRVQYFAALQRAGIGVALYGDYWRRFPATRGIARGQIDIATLRLALASSDVCLCLVRRANRDEHCMRTFEVPAVGGCLLAEDTRDHREIFGAEGGAALYFSSIAEMLEKTRHLLAHPAERQRLAAAAAAIVRQPRHSYSQRLESMLQGLAVSSQVAAGVSAARGEL